MRNARTESRKSEIDHRELAITSRQTLPMSIDCVYESNSKPNDATSFMETADVTLCSHAELKRFKKFSKRAVLMNIRIEFPFQVGEKASASRVRLLCHLHGLRLRVGFRKNGFLICRRLTTDNTMPSSDIVHSRHRKKPTTK